MRRVSGRSVVITGGAGFIGSHVTERFLARGYDAVVVDDLSTGKRENVPDGAELVELDIRDATQLGAVVAAASPAAVCHLAAQASVTRSVREPELDLAVNVAGTLNVVEAAREAGAPVVFASTGGALYGDGAPLPTPEDAPARPASPYGASKLAGEAYVTAWGALGGTPSVVLRLGNVYGPRQEAHGEAGVVAIFSACLLEDRPPTVYGNGAPTRDYVYVGDVADAFVLAAESGRAGTFNVGTGVATSVNEVLALLEQAAGRSAQPELAPLRPGEIEQSALDCARIERELGWRAQVPVAEGLPATFAWFSAP